MEKEGNLNGNSKSDDENEKDSENEFDLYITEFNDILAVMLKDPNVFVFDTFLWLYFDVGHELRLLCIHLYQQGQL